MTADHAKAIAEYFAAIFDREGPNTVKVLRAVPDERRDHKPDEKSRTAWELAKHVATADIWFLDSICDGCFTWDPDAEKRMASGFSTMNDVVEFYKQTLPEKLQQLRSLSPDAMTREVDFFGFMKAPAVTFLGIANNHGIHHRGQLASYLRAHGSKVPAIYGGSADEPMQAAG